MKVVHKPWCYRSWRPVAYLGGTFTRGPRKGMDRVEKRTGGCNCGATVRAKRQEQSA